MSNVGQLLLSSLFQDVVDEGGKIFQSHLLLTEAPEFGIRLVESSVILSVSGASVVTKPNIISLFGKDKGGCIRGNVRGPEV